MSCQITLQRGVRGFQPQAASSVTWFGEGAAGSVPWQTHPAAADSRVCFAGYCGQV